MLTKFELKCINNDDVFKCLILITNYKIFTLYTNIILNVKVMYRIGIMSSYVTTYILYNYYINKPWKLFEYRFFLKGRDVRPMLFVDQNNNF